MKPSAWGQPDAVGNIIDAISSDDRDSDVTLWHSQYIIPLYAIPEGYVVVPIELMTMLRETLEVFRYSGDDAPDDGWERANEAIAMIEVSTGQNYPTLAELVNSLGNIPEVSGKVKDKK